MVNDGKSICLRFQSVSFWDKRQHCATECDQSDYMQASSAPEKEQVKSEPKSIAYTEEWKDLENHVGEIEKT